MGVPKEAIDGLRLSVDTWDGNQRLSTPTVTHFLPNKKGLKHEENGEILATTMKTEAVSRPPSGLTWRSHGSLAHK